MAKMWKKQQETEEENPDADDPDVEIWEIWDIILYSYFKPFSVIEYYVYIILYFYSL